MQELSFLDTLFSLAVLIFSVVAHEVAHGYAALALGDKTALRAGRLTLNPISHIDPIGSLLVPLVLALLPGSFMIGWAKPVPYNPYNLRDQRWGDAKVGVAGPATNIAIAVAFGLILRGFATELAPAAISLLAIIVFVNITLAIFNLVPIPPLDGSKLLYNLLPFRYRYIIEYLERYAFVLILFFAFFLWPSFAGMIQWIFVFLVGGG
jgi:Zn-dependent protease